MGSRTGILKQAAQRTGVTPEQYAQRLSAGQKFCTRCRAWKDATAFGRDRSRHDGLSAKCFVCSRAPGAGPRRKLSDAKRQARNAVNDAIRKGRMAPIHGLPCFDCGGTAEEYDHHRGYDRSAWLDVHAVCCRCHRRRDAGRRA